MFSKTVVIASLVALATARFGQENLVQDKIAALSGFGAPGQAATLASQSPRVLLDGASACDKLSLADDIVSQLGTDNSVIAAAKALVQAEKNFSPLAQSVPTLCGDASLPATAALRGIVPLVDPAVDGAATENANAAASINSPFNAAGLSVADVAKAQGFANFIT